MTRKELARALRRQLNPQRARWQKPGAEALAAMKAGRIRGKIVLTVS